MKFAWLCSHESYQPEQLLEQAVAAEKAGFDMVTGADHFHPWVDDQCASSFVWSWFGAAAHATERVELATSVTCPLFHYHPGVIAQAAATVDRLSNGLFRIGVGTGEAINERPLGYSFPGHKERIARMKEALDIMRALLDGEKLDYDGDYYTTKKARLYSPPVARVPIWMAAGGPKSAAFAGKTADGLIVSVKDPAEALMNVIGPFRSAAEKRGATPTIMATRWVTLGEDDDECWQALMPMRGLRAPGRLEECDPMVLRQRADEMDRAEILSKYAKAADADELLDTYRPLVTDVGADYVAIQIASRDPIDTIEMVGSKVLPRLQAL